MKRSVSTRPLVSVCIASYNYGRFIRDAIESALNQTYPEIEVVVSDNNSTDETHAILASYRNDPRVRVFINPENVGMVPNHNLSLQRAQGDYIVSLSADDILFPQHVDLLLRRILDPFDPVRIAAGQGMFVTEELEPITPFLTLGHVTGSYSHRDDLANLFFNYHHFMPGKLIERSAYQEIGFITEKMRTSLDIDIAAKMESANISCAVIPDMVAAIRKHGTRASEYSRHLTDEIMNDKLTMIELGMQPQNAWRIEGYERHIITMLQRDIEHGAAAGQDPIQPEQHERLLRLCTHFSALADTTPQWPLSEPELSVIILSEGYVALLNQTLKILAEQGIERCEIVVVQTSGYDLGAWVSRLPLAKQIRVVQIRACATPLEAFRCGLDLARGEYVTYLNEGQRVPANTYGDVIHLGREANSQVLALPKALVDEYFPPLVERESRPHQFADPATRAFERLHGPEYGICQIIHRRGILRPGNTLHLMMGTDDEATFIGKLSANFRTSTLNPMALAVGV